MAEESSSPFRRALETVGIKGPSRRLKFMPNITQPASDKGKDASSSALSQKEHRRAQVRRAQILHRQHKKNYIKFLEEDVMRLREMISSVEIETAACKEENTAIKYTLTKGGVPTSLFTLPDPKLKPLPSIPVETADFQETPRSNGGDTQPFQQSSQWYPQSDSSSNTRISVTFDERIDTSRLQISPANDFDAQDVLGFPASSGSNVDPIPGLPDPTTLFADPPLQFQAGYLDTMPQQLDKSYIGINFILALEHPCRTHFNAPEAEFDPTGASSNHQLMATAILYSQAPAQVFPNLDQAAWASPALELTKLWEMSQSLPKGDWEITPVQAWFLLSAAYDTQTLLANSGVKLEALKCGLSKIVDCMGFGTVLDVGRFWGVVNSIMGEVPVTAGLS